MFSLLLERAPKINFSDYILTYVLLLSEYKALHFRYKRSHFVA